MGIGKYEVSITDAEGNEMKGIADSSDIVRSGYVSAAVERLRLSLEKLSWSIDGARILICKIASLSRGKVRKTTYRTIRRDCAKRNRRK